MSLLDRMLPARQPDYASQGSNDHPNGHHSLDDYFKAQKLRRQQAEAERMADVHKQDDPERAARFKAHADQLQQRIDRLMAKYQS